VLAANLEAVRGRIEAACERSGRERGSVKLIGVTKGVSAERLAAAVDLGLTDIGENYVQEAAAKRALLAGAAKGPAWHLIGHLQRNKVQAALACFDTIQAVDSAGLAEALSYRATRPLAVLLEVNAGGEPSKFGFAPDEVSAAVKAIAKLPKLDLRGLMTVAPGGQGVEAARAAFRTLAGLARANGLTELSMGMTGDFEVAIEEGATMVRIGRAVFGERS
jgi:pyridoxal phosphate enzyme (YggS family)